MIVLPVKDIDHLNMANTIESGQKIRPKIVSISGDSGTPKTALRGNIRMKTGDLRELGLTPVQIQYVMKEYGKGLNLWKAEREEYKARLAEVRIALQKMEEIQQKIKKAIYDPAFETLQKHAKEQKKRR